MIFQMSVKPQRKKSNKCVLYEEIVVVAASTDVVVVVAAGWCVRKSTCEHSLRWDIEANGNALILFVARLRRIFVDKAPS